MAPTMTLTEAANKWKLDSSTLRHAIRNGRFNRTEDARQSGATWLVSSEAMKRLYGNPADILNIYTIGYESLWLDDFGQVLKNAGITHLLDVREYAYSRKRGYSKGVLAKYLESIGISYAHEKRLGSPKTMRDSLHSTKDYASFFMEYESYLDTQIDALSEWTATISSAPQERWCLMCFEKNAKMCHRSATALRIAKSSKRVIRGIVNLHSVDTQTDTHSRQDLSDSQR